MLSLSCASPITVRCHSIATGCHVPTSNNGFPTTGVRAVVRRTLPQPVRRRLASAYVVARRASVATRFDLSNRRSFGREAPKYAERVWIDPLACSFAVATRSLRRQHTGQVIDGDWDQQVRSLSASVKIKAVVNCTGGMGFPGRKQASTNICWISFESEDPLTDVGHSRKLSPATNVLMSCSGKCVPKDG